MAQQYDVSVTLQGTETVTLRYGRGTAASVIGTVAQLIADYEKESQLRGTDWDTELVSVTVTKVKE